MRTRYWGNSKLADWIRGTMKPKAETWSNWRKWEKQAKAKHPIRYWIAEEGLDGLQNIIHWPTDQLYSLKYWFNNRFITKTHALTASSLKKGQWHEYETRLLHSMFDEMVNFVEIEQAWFYIAWDDEAKNKYKAPFYASGWFRWRTWRCPEAGIASLQWASKLTNEEFLDGTENHKAEPTQQAITAQELLALYHWWTTVRPARPDPHDASGWSDWCEHRRGLGIGILDDENTDEDRAATNAILDRCHEIEAAYEKEDEEMMIRLIKIRRGLWT